MRKILYSVIIAASLCSCSDSKTNESGGVDASQAVVRKPDADVKKPDAVKADTASHAVTETKPAAATADGGKWQYADEVDKMTSKTTQTATIDANELLNFPFPYDGGQTATILVRHKGNKNDVLLSVTKGQFVSHGDEGSVSVRFDDAQPVKFATSEPSDGSSNVIFIDNAAKFLKKVKSATKTIIQAEFYESGLKTMEFNSKDFKWEH